MEESEGLSREFRATVESLGLTLSAAAEAALLDYGRLLLTWAKVINLTGATTLEELGRRHFIDAAAVAKLVMPGARVVDVGSGAGLPAIPLSILRPDLNLTLVEPTAKRVAFLRTAVRQAGLNGRVQVVNGRVGRNEIIFEGDWDAATARAVWSPYEWVSQARPLVRGHGQIFVFCVSRAEAEGVAAGGAALGYATDRWLAVVTSNEATAPAA